MDDLNYLLRRQQEERTRAENAACDASRNAHEELAQAYEALLGRFTEGRVRLGRQRTSRATVTSWLPWVRLENR